MVGKTPGFGSIGNMSRCVVLCAPECLGDAPKSTPSIQSSPNSHQLLRPPFASERWVTGDFVSRRTQIPMMFVCKKSTLEGRCSPHWPVRLSPERARSQPFTMVEKKCSLSVHIRGHDVFGHRTPFVFGATGPCWLTNRPHHRVSEFPFEVWSIPYSSGCFR